MKKLTFWKFSATVAFLCSLGACSNSSAPDELDDGSSTTPTSASSSKSSSSGATKTKSSASNANQAACDALKEVLAAPSGFAIEKVTDSSWTLSWDYTRNDNRPEEGFEIQVLDMDAESPEWEHEGNSNADVTIYKLEGAKKAGKYYRVAAYDKCATSKESNRMQIKSNGYGDAETTTPKTDIPTDVAIVRVAPSVWELSWKYSETTDNPNRKFVIQTSKLKDFKWTGVKSSDGKDQFIDGNVRHYYIQGRDKIETYYRMAVVNSGDTSAFTEAIQLTPDIAYRDYMALNVPEPSTKYSYLYTIGIEANNDTATRYDETVTQVVATFTVDNNFISKYIVESEYTDTVYYEVRWFNSLENYNYYKGNCEGKKKNEKCDSCYWSETFPYQEPSVSKRFDVRADFADAAKTTSVFKSCAASTGFSEANHEKLFDPDTSASHKAEWSRILQNEFNMSLCLQSYLSDICGYYAQFRIVWKDNTNGKGKGETDWSEWSAPISLDGATRVCSPE